MHANVTINRCKNFACRHLKRCRIGCVSLGGVHHVGEMLRVVSSNCLTIQYNHSVSTQAHWTN